MEGKSFQPEEKKEDGILFQSNVKDFGFSDLRLKNSNLFSFVIKKGRRYNSPSFLIYVLSDEKEEMFKFGILNNIAAGRAAVRNRTKRLVREFFRLNRQRIKKGFVFVIKPKISLKEKKYNDIEKEFEEFFTKKNLFITDRPAVD